MTRYQEQYNAYHEVAAIRQHFTCASLFEIEKDTFLPDVDGIRPGLYDGNYVHIEIKF